MSTYLAGLAVAATFNCFARPTSDLHILSASPLLLVAIPYRTALATNNLIRRFIAPTAYVLYFRCEYK